MEKFWIDLHSHSTFSHDGKNTPAEMLETALKRGIFFFGVSEHFCYELDLTVYDEAKAESLKDGDPNEYFHTLRHLQEDYEGVMNVAVGGEFGYGNDEKAQAEYKLICEKFHPDYVINSVHCIDGIDLCRLDYTNPRYSDKKTVYGRYLRLVRDSLDAPYPYDIVGHIGYASRYIRFEDDEEFWRAFGEQIDDILLTIIQKDKILEVNTANKGLPNITVPDERVLARYFALGGRKVSFGSDAHFVERIADKYEEAVEMLKKIGFTYFTVPFCGERIKVEF